MPNWHRMPTSPAKNDEQQQRLQVCHLSNQRDGPGRDQECRCQRSGRARGTASLRDGLVRTQRKTLSGKGLTEGAPRLLSSA